MIEVNFYSYCCDICDKDEHMDNFLYVYVFPEGSTKKKDKNGVIVACSKKKRVKQYNICVECFDEMKPHTRAYL